MNREIIVSWPSEAYTLPSGHDEALIDDTSLNCIAPIGQLVAACAKPIDAVLDAFRTSAAPGVRLAERDMAAAGAFVAVCVSSRAV